MIIQTHTKLDATDSFVKVVVDLKRTILASGCDLHIDCAEELMRDGSDGKDLWGANVYPKTGRIDFLSMINISPARGNMEMELKDVGVREQMRAIISTLLL